MDVSAVGAVQPPMPPGDATLSRVAHLPVAEAREDSVGGLGSATRHAANPRPPEWHRRAAFLPTALCKAAASAVADHDVTRALTHLAEYIKQYPEPRGLCSWPLRPSCRSTVRSRNYSATSRLGGELIEAEHMIASASLRLVSSSAEAQRAEVERTLNGPEVLAVACSDSPRPGNYTITSGHRN